MVSAENSNGESLFSVENESQCCKYIAEHPCVTIGDTIAMKNDYLTIPFTPLTNTKGGSVGYKVRQRVSGSTSWQVISPNPLPQGQNQFTAYGLTYG